LRPPFRIRRHTHWLRRRSIIDIAVKPHSHSFLAEHDFANHQPHLLPGTLHWSHFAAWTLAPWTSYASIAVALAGLVNAVNMADGQDGIVVGMFIIWSICLMATTSGLPQDLAFVLFVSCTIALAFNLLGRVFLGDGGPTASRSSSESWQSMRTIPAQFRRKLLRYGSSSRLWTACVS